MESEVESHTGSTRNLGDRPGLDRLDGIIRELAAGLGGDGSGRSASPALLRGRAGGVGGAGGHDPKHLADLEAAVVRICNAALGRDGDPTAKASRLGNCLLIESSNQALQRYAGMLIRAIDGIEITTAEHFGITGTNGGGGGGMAMGGSFGFGNGGNPFSPEAWLGRDGPRSRAP